MKISMNKNGNKILTISGADLHRHHERGFSIETNGNLPDVHRLGLDYSNIKFDVFEFVKEFGTDRQKRMLMTDQEFTLADVVNGSKRGTGYNKYGFWKRLTVQDVQQIADLVGGHHHTKERVKSVLSYHLSHFPRWFLERVSYAPEYDRWSYCAGQDYTYEMASIRKLCK